LRIAFDLRKVCLGYIYSDKPENIPTRDDLNFGRKYGMIEDITSESPAVRCQALDSWELEIFLAKEHMSQGKWQHQTEPSRKSKHLPDFNWKFRIGLWQRRRQSFAAVTFFRGV
jgi:hypothetical protein